MNIYNISLERYLIVLLHVFFFWGGGGGGGGGGGVACFIKSMQNWLGNLKLKI